MIEKQRAAFAPPADGYGVNFLGTSPAGGAAVRITPRCGLVAMLNSYSPDI